MKPQLQPNIDEPEREAAAIWNSYYSQLKDAYLFPNEYVVRTFLGQYPNLTMRRDYKDAKICDVSCGDGRNTVVLHKLDFDIYCTEITDEVCAITRQKLLDSPEQIKVDIRPGVNDNLPFESEFFDYLLSWNACYYMRDEQADFNDHVREFARVMKKGAYFIACVPAPTCFSLEGAEKLDNHMVRINTKTQWSLLNGSIYRLFESQQAIEEAFGEHFENFQHGKLVDDCYGQALHYFIFVCQKR